jgi:hypothetical protein
MPVKFSEVQNAFDFANFGSDMGENQAFLDRRTGEFHYHSDLLGDDEEGNTLPDDVEGDENYVQLPDKRDLDLGTSLVFDFVRQHMPDDYGDVRAIFQSRGAYGRFKAWLAGRRALDAWYEFETKAQQAALRAWCADEGLELSD